MWLYKYNMFALNHLKHIISLLIYISQLSLHRF
nr:MAG TPA: hypothetical protein [Caudoviricetes sp.]